MKGLIFLVCIFLAARAVRSEVSRICTDESCRVDNIEQDSILEHEFFPMALTKTESAIWLDCDFLGHTMNITIQAPEGMQTRIITDDIEGSCPRNGETNFQMQYRAVFVDKRTEIFDFDDIQAVINEQNGNFEFRKEVCILQLAPHPTDPLATLPVHTRLQAACCLEPECVPHSLIIPIVPIVVGVCKTDDWLMTSDAGTPDRHSSFSIQPLPSTAPAIPNAPLQYVKRCTVNPQNSSPFVSIVEQGKLQHQDILKSSGKYDSNKRIFNFEFLTFVPSGMVTPIDWSGNNNTCPLISCQFGYCSTDGSTGSKCADFYKNIEVPSGVWEIKSA